MPARMNISKGDVYARLTIIREVDSANKLRRFLCKCLCGNSTEVYLGHLRTGKTTSCGCVRCEVTADRSRELMGTQLAGRSHQHTKSGRRCLIVATAKAAKATPTTADAASRYANVGVGQMDLPTFWKIWVNVLLDYK